MGNPETKTHLVNRMSQYGSPGMLISFHNVLQVLLEGVSGENATGDIAVDDMSVLYEPCPNPGACNFDRGDLCTWTNSREEGGVWLLTSGGTPDDETGPSVDHTTGTSEGFYLYIEASIMMPGDAAVLISEPIMADEEMCIQLYYHMWGAGCDQLLHYIYG